MGTENKRKEERVVPHVLEPVEVQVIGEGFLEILSAKDIGPGGIGIYVAHGFQWLNIVREVEVILSIPNEDSFKTRGVIKYKRQFHNHNDPREFYGILFTQIAIQHRSLLEKYVDRRMDDKRHHVQVEPDAGRPVEVSLIGENGLRPV